MEGQSNQFERLGLGPPRQAPCDQVGKAAELLQVWFLRSDGQGSTGVDSRRMSGAWRPQVRGGGLGLCGSPGASFFDARRDFAGGLTDGVDAELAVEAAYVSSKGVEADAHGLGDVLVAGAG